MKNKFLFNLYTLTLKIPQGPNSYSVFTEIHQFHLLGGIGFVLEWSGAEYQSEPNSWIIFKVNQEKVKVIYKTQGTHYQRTLSRPPGGIVEVEFSELDRVKSK